MAFRKARQNHPGVESVIGALQKGNGLKRARDRSKKGYERYVALGILGRNLQTLGKLLLARDKADCQAAQSKPGTPTSASGGSSGAAGARCAVVTPSARTLPAWISG